MRSLIPHHVMMILAIFFFMSCTISLAHEVCSPKEFLDVHNQARAEVGVGPLSWNHNLEAYAQNYADLRSHDCNLEHSNGPYGENIAEGYGEMKDADAAKLWFAEKPNYDPHSNSCVNDECLHYTQMVWRDSVHLGCAKSKCNNGWVFVVCNYDPPGNYVGDRPY